MIVEVLHDVPDWPATAATLRRQHREILKAVREGRVEDVASAVEEHIRDFHGLLVERVGTGSPAAQRERGRSTASAGATPRRAVARHRRPPAP